MTFFSELKRRNVFRVGAAYAVTAWVLLQILDVVGDILELPEWGGKLILVLLLIGFFIALIFAWAFEVTPEGVKREKDVDRSRSIASQTGRKLDRVIIGVLAIAVIYLLVDKLLLQQLVEPPAASPEAAQSAAPAETSPSLAVLPFVNMSGDADNEYFSDGLTETLLHRLSQLPGLRVAARTSSFAFKGQSIGIGEIASALGVAHVLEGSVQKADDRVRITAQLIRAEDGFHVWSQNYTRPLQDIFAIQDEIAADVADALGSSLLGSGSTRRHVVSTSNLDAYDSYLKGLEQQAIYSYGALDQAENHFKQALARDPAFMDARLALARNHLLKFGTGLINRDEVRARAYPLIEQARAEDPENALAESLGIMLSLFTAAPADSEQEIRERVTRLQELLPMVPTETLARVVVAQNLAFYFSDSQRAIEVLQAGLLIDPLQAELHRWLGRVYARMDRLDEARATLQRALELAPDNPNNYSTLGELEVAAGNLPAALDWIRQAIEKDPQDHEIAASIARYLYGLGLVEEGDYWAARVKALAPESGLARLLEVERAVALADLEQVITRSAAMIADQVDLRQGAFAEAGSHYADTMLSAGRAREGYEFLIGLRPEIADYGAVPPDVQGIFMQWASLYLMSGFESFERRREAWIRFDEARAANGFPGKYDPADQYHTWDYLMRGEVEQAVGHYLEYGLARPLTADLHRVGKPFQATFGPVYEDPRVAARLAEDAERYAQLREEVRAMLQRPEWDNP
jgi:TolB-like protein/Tfp pilus assembly protein PilF